MATDRQVMRAMRWLDQGRPLWAAALWSGIDVKTVRKYRRLGTLPTIFKGSVPQACPMHAAFGPTFGAPGDAFRTINLFSIYEPHAIQE